MSCTNKDSVVNRKQLTNSLIFSVEAAHLLIKTDCKRTIHYISLLFSPKKKSIPLPFCVKKGRKEEGVSVKFLSSSSIMNTWVLALFLLHSKHLFSALKKGRKAASCFQIDGLASKINLSTFFLFLFIEFFFGEKADHKQTHLLRSKEST